MRFLKNIEHKYIVAIIYTCVLFLDRLDLTIVNIALPTLANYFKIPITQTEWIANAFLLALAMSIPVSGWIGDRFGIKKVFIFATSLFGICALLCAFTHNFYVMVLLRFLEGIGGGIVIPVGMSMLYRVFEPSEYASITSFTFMPALIAPAVAPALGGTIIHFLSWQWIFLFSSSLCLLSVAFSLAVLKNYETEKPKPLDWIGFLLASASLILILYVLSDFGKYGFSSKTMYLSLLTILLIYSFIKQEGTVSHPLFDLQLFKNKLFLQANLIQLAFQICHYASFFIIGMYLQVGLGMSALSAGMILGSQALGAMSISRMGVKLFHLYGPGLTIMVGFIGIGFFTASLLLINRPDLFWISCAIMFCRGLSSGLCGMPMQIASILGFEKSQLGQASAVFNAGRQVAITLGIALASFMISYAIKQQGITVVAGKPSLFYSAIYLVIFVAMIGVFLSARMNNKEALQLVNQ